MMLTMDATLHAHAELMKELKVGQQAKWDHDYEIGVWSKHELELTGGEVEVEAVPLQAAREEETLTAIEPREVERPHEEQKEEKELTRNLQAELENAGSNT